jgi:hypothetical protein
VQIRAARARHVVSESRRLARSIEIGAAEHVCLCTADIDRECPPYPHRPWADRWDVWMPRADEQTGHSAHLVAAVGRLSSNPRAQATLTSSDLSGIRQGSA